jgi:hypothetical protein
MKEACGTLLLATSAVVTCAMLLVVHLRAAQGVSGAELEKACDEAN